jgi:purine-binding chemotaxis protein CheW
VRVAGEDYALSVADVLEVAELGEVTQVPGAGREIMGVRNLRGQVVPVVDLARVLDLTDGATPKRIVIAEQGGRKAGLAVDEVAGVEQLPEASEDVESPHLVRAALVGGSLVGLVDIGSVLDAVQGSTGT